MFVQCKAHAYVRMHAANGRTDGGNSYCMPVCRRSGTYNIPAQSRVPAHVRRVSLSHRLIAHGMAVANGKGKPERRGGSGTTARFGWFVHAMQRELQCRLARRKLWGTTATSPWLGNEELDTEEVKQKAEVALGS